MLRITENFENGKIVRLRLDGTITPDSFTDLAEICAGHGANAETIIVMDMAGVTFMNDETAEKIARLRSERLRIINCSPFVETLLQTKERS